MSENIIGSEVEVQQTVIGIGLMDLNSDPPLFGIRLNMKIILVIIVSDLIMMTHFNKIGEVMIVVIRMELFANLSYKFTNNFSIYLNITNEKKKNKKKTNKQTKQKTLCLYS